MKKVLFHRHYDHFSGGHLKIWDYFNHVAATQGFEPVMYLTKNSANTAGNLWVGCAPRIADSFDPNTADILFLAGRDWAALPASIRERPSRPIISLLQSIRHSQPTHRAYKYIKHPAIRVAVSEQVREAFLSTGCVNGPIFTVPNGLDCASLPKVVPWEHRQTDILICAYKHPRLGRDIADLLSKFSLKVNYLPEPIERTAYLHAVSQARVAVLLPRPAEGFYLPALECMLLEVLTVCPDCVGNRNFCVDGRTAEVPDYDSRAMTSAALNVLGFSKEERETRFRHAKKITGAHSIENERQSFQWILKRADTLWDSIVRPQKNHYGRE